MPYKIAKRGSRFCVINKDTGETKGCSDNYRDAVASMRARYGAEHGWKPTGKKPKS